MNLLLNQKDITILWLKYVISPWSLIGISLLVIHYLFYIYKQKRFYGQVVKFNLLQFLKTIFLGLCIGLISTLIFSNFPIVISPREILLVWTLTLVLFFFGIRFVSIAYSVGILSLVSLYLKTFPEHIDSLSGLGYELANFSCDWLWVVSVLYMLFGFFMRLEGDYGNTPCRVKWSERSIWGFKLNKSMFIPSIVITPYGILPLYTMLGFSSATISKNTKQNLRMSSSVTFLLGLIMALVMVISLKLNEVLWIASALSLLGPELIYQIHKSKDKKNQPIYVSGSNGLLVLEVLPKSSSKSLGIKAGYIIQKVNETLVYTPECLESATNKVPFVRLEVLDENLDKHIMNKAVFEDEPLSLGIIGAE